MKCRTKAEIVRALQNDCAYLTNAQCVAAAFDVEDTWGLPVYFHDKECRKRGCIGGWNTPCIEDNPDRALLAAGVVSSTQPDRENVICDGSRTCKRHPGARAPHRYEIRGDQEWVLPTTGESVSSRAAKETT